MRRPDVVPRVVVTVLLVSTGWVRDLAAQTTAQPDSNVCRGDRSLQGLPIHSVKIESRGGWQPVVRLPFAPGDTFDFPMFSAAHSIVSRALNDDPARESFEASGQGFFSFSFVSSCVTVIEGPLCGRADGAGAATRCVDILIRPYSVRLDLLNAGGNVIPVPRSNRATFYDQVPGFLKAFNPTFGIGRDRQMGVLGGAATSTNLLTLGPTIRGDPPAERKARLDLDLQGSKSLDKQFYETHSELRFDRRRTGSLVEGLFVFTDASVNQQPLADGRHFNNAARAGGALTFRPGSGAVGRLMLGGNYRWTDHRFFGTDVAQRELTGEHSFEGRAVADGRAGDGTWRSAVWLEANAPEQKIFDSYRRLALLGGYQRELGRTEQTVGIEVLAGAGAAWGVLPAYARFYGGTGPGNFLYDGPETAAMRSFPAGPLLRSFGRAEVGGEAVGPAAEGGFYWHVNLNLTVPLPRFSCPLIPAIALFDDVDAQNGTANPCRIERPPAGVKTLKDSMNGMVTSGESFLRADIAEQLVMEGMDSDEADKEGAARAARVFREIRPAMHFITEKANLYAVKPLFMLDVGGITSGGPADQLTRVGVGGGLQVVIAVAKFEIGYMHAARRVTGDPPGNLIARFVFRNLF